MWCEEAESFGCTRDSPQPFGGMTVMFGGDFQQTLPIIQGGSHEQIIHTCLNHLSSTRPKSFSSPKTCTFPTTRIQQWLNLHNSSLTLDMERTYLLMEMSTCPGISASMAPPFSHLSSTYTQLSNPIHILHQHTSSITCSLPQGMRMYMSSTMKLLTCAIVGILKRWVIGVHVIHSEDTEFHFTLGQHQFTIALEFTMTIIKSQGQTLLLISLFNKSTLSYKQVMGLELMILPRLLMSSLVDPMPSCHLKHVLMVSTYLHVSRLNTVTYKTVASFNLMQCWMNRYLHIGPMNKNKINCVGKHCFPVFKQGVNHAFYIRLDGDTDQSLLIMHCNSFVADNCRT